MSARIRDFPHEKYAASIDWTARLLNEPAAKYADDETNSDEALSLLEEKQKKGESLNFTDVMNITNDWPTAEQTVLVMNSIDEKKRRDREEECYRLLCRMREMDAEANGPGVDVHAATAAAVLVTK